MQKVSYKDKSAGHIELKSIHPLDKCVVYGYLREKQTIYFDSKDIQYFNLFIVATIIILYSKGTGNIRKIKYSIHREVFLLYDYYKPCKYKPLSGLNHTYTKCLNVINKRTDITYLIKKHKDVFVDLTDGMHILSEIKLLMHFKHSNIVSIIDTIPCDTAHIHTYTDVYLIMPKMETTLQKAITNRKIKLRNSHCQFLMYQILRAVTYIHSANITHGNLQSKNILINCSDYRIKLTDFSFSNVVTKDHTIDKLNRWYLSPESLIHGKVNNFDTNGDVWSLGCIFAELLLRKPLFSAQNRFDQLREMFELIGTPTDLSWIQGKAAKKWIQRLQMFAATDFGEVFKKASKDGLDLLKVMLKMNPLRRYSALNCLKHSYIKSFYREKKDEKVCPAFVELDEKMIKSKLDLRLKMYEVLTSYW